MFTFLVSVAKMLAAALLFFASLFPFSETSKEIAVLRESGITLPAGFTVTAHAGSMYTVSNALYSIRMIAATDADIIEVDLNFRPDGTAVLYHDSNPGQDEGTLLAKALEAIAQNPTMRINIDVKSTLNMPRVQELLADYGLSDRAFFTGVTSGRCDLVQRECPGIPYYLNVSVDETTDLQALAEETIRHGAVGVNLSFTGASAALCETMHNNGLLVSVWTVNNRLDMYRMLSFGVDNITTSNPLILMEIQQNYL